MSSKSSVGVSFETLSSKCYLYPLKVSLNTESKIDFIRSVTTSIFELCLICGGSRAILGDETLSDAELHCWETCQFVFLAYVGFSSSSMRGSLDAARLSWFSGPSKPSE